MTHRATLRRPAPDDGREASEAPGQERLVTPARAISPTLHDPVARAASHVVGGPQGRFAAVGRHGWRPAAAVLSALSSVFVALGVLQKNHCVGAGWATPGSLWRACYSDLPVAVSGPAGSTPWSSPAIGGQPPLTAIVTWIARLLVPGGSQLRLQQGMFAWGAAIVALLVALTVCASAATLPKGPWAAAHVALSPVLITSALISFDALGVALVAAGLLAWHRSRFSLAGAALAGALLTRPMLGAVLVAALVVALSRGRTRAAQGVALGAGAVVAGVLGLQLVCGGDPTAPLRAWSSQGAGFGSIWYALTFAGVTLSAGTLTALALLGWALAIALGMLLARRRPELPLAPITLLVLVVVMLTARALPVQACLWVLPLIAACCLPWRDHLVWAGAEFAYFVTVWGFIARGSNMAKALPPGWFGSFTVLRLLGLVLLVASGLRWSPLLASDAVADARRAGSHEEATGHIAHGRSGSREPAARVAPSSTAIRPR